MKNSLIVILLLFLASCDYEGNYSFKVKNSTSKLIEIKFNDTTKGSPYIDTANHMDVIILKGEEKTIRIISAPLNSPAHNCLQMHGMTYFHDLIFDTYLDGKKVEKQMWQPDNWTYRETSKYSAEYKMDLTDELCK